MPDTTPTMFILRGLPGAGKSRLALLLARDNNAAICSADAYFTADDGTYRFDPKDIAKAHAACYWTATTAAKAGQNVIIDNTNCCRWEMENYIQLAAANGFTVSVISIFDGGLTDEALAARNSHGVPVFAIAAMRARFEHDWATGNPVAPWYR